MELSPLPAEREAVRRYVEELWLPYHRTLSAVTESYALADDVDLVTEEAEFRLDLLDGDDHRAWLAVEDAEAPVDVAAGDGDLIGFVTCDVDAAPTVFERSGRMHLGDIYVADSHRGTGLARRLVERVADAAREADCEAVTLDVDVTNERALAFYEKLGFGPFRRTLLADANDLSDRD